MNKKTVALIGFAIRAGNIIYGLDKIEAQRVRKYLIIMDKNAGANTAKNINRITSEKNIPLIISDTALEDAVYKKNCKVIAITDENIANGILTDLSQNYER